MPGNCAQTCVSFTGPKMATQYNQLIKPVPNVVSRDTIPITRHCHVIWWHHRQFGIYSSFPAVRASTAATN